MSAIVHTQLPPAVEGDTYNGKIDYTNQLDSGETISAATVTELTSSDLTITNAQANAAAITVQGVTVAIGKGVTFTCAGMELSTGIYRLQIVYTTSASQSKTRFAHFQVTHART